MPPVCSIAPSKACCPPNLHIRSLLQQKEKKEKTDRTSRQTQAGIGHSAPAHRGGHVQNRIRRRQHRTRSVGGATTHGRRTRQAGESVPTQTRSGAGGCTPQTSCTPNLNITSLATNVAQRNRPRPPTGDPLGRAPLGRAPQQFVPHQSPQQQRQRQVSRRGHPLVQVWVRPGHEPSR